nr:MiaB/RimO family radical SAM methylthiotransferase [Candidatus Gracilibacteria bacterium]
MKFYFSAINLGCTKNLVDLEYVVGQILSGVNGKDVKFFEKPESKQVEYLIINTCGFLSSSRDEAEGTIRYYDDLGKKIILMGCYIPVRDDEFLKSLKNLYKIIPQKESEHINSEIFGGDNKSDLKSKLQNFKEGKLKDYLKNLDRLESDKKAFIWGSNSIRMPFNSPYGHEFVKISEGCDNRCSFCIIPKIRGDQKSRSIEDILNEIKTLVNMGIKEIEIISQDTTRYGSDLYGEVKFFELLEEIENLNLDFRYRIFYLYPDILTFSHLEKLKKFKKFIPYFDLPFQHISPKILKRMGRFYDNNHIIKLLDFIKTNFKDAFLHTNFIVGFPGESESDFKELVDFAKKYEFDSVSMFGYHDEQLAASSKLDQKVDDKEIIRRVDILSKILNEIYDKKEKFRVGKEFTGYVYDFDDKNVHIRWEYKAPELDELDVIPLENILSGEVEIGEKVRYKK